MPWSAFEVSAAIEEIIADAARCERNSALPIRELMWGLAGSMLACVHIHAMNGEPRWRRLFAAQDGRLLDDLEGTPLGPLWNQDLYGGVLPWLGPVHGYAGDMIPLLRGSEWLTQQQRARVPDVAPHTLAATACRSDVGSSAVRAGRARRPLSALPRCTGHGDDICRRAVRVARARCAARRGRHVHLGGRTARQGVEPVPRHRRQWIDLAGVRLRVRDDGDRAVPRGARRAEQGRLLAMDRRRRVGDLSLGLHHGGTALPYRRRILIGQQ
jgi:hypothetical protein